MQRLIQIWDFISDFEKFKLAPSKLNPADLGTKNLSPEELFSNKLWFSGPQFLSLLRNWWPDLHVGASFSNCNIDHSSIDSVDGESLILSNSCTKSNANNVKNLNLVDKEKLVENKSTYLISTFHKNFGVPTAIDITDYSSYMRLLHVTEWVIKFIERLKSLKNPNCMCNLYCVSAVLVSMGPRYLGFGMYKGGF